MTHTRALSLALSDRLNARRAKERGLAEYAAPIRGADSASVDTARPTAVPASGHQRERFEMADVDATTGVVEMIAVRR